MGTGKVFSRREVEEDILLLDCEICGKEDVCLHAHIIKDKQYRVACLTCLNEILDKITKATK